MEGKVDGRDLLLGNMKLMKQREVAVREEVENQGDGIAGRRKHGDVRRDRWTAGRVDHRWRTRSKGNAADALAALHSLDLKVVMLTGDAEATARTVSQKLGIDEFHANVSPRKRNMNS
ncbi:MAG: hypothetical protein R3C11_29280 [Planctomycetaceae bacterium]